jgi:hypothetical protein
MGASRDSAWATHGVFTEAYAWKTCTRVRWARLDSVIVIVNCCHSWCLRSYVCRVIRLFPLQGWLLIQKSVTPSEMGDACSPNLNVELSTS